MEPKKERKPYSDEYRRHMSEVRKGIPKSPEHRAKIGKGNSGKVRTPEMRKHMSEIKIAYWANRKSIDSTRKEDS